MRNSGSPWTVKLAGDDSSHDLLDAADDRLHDTDDHRWYTETWWFWWYRPEERIGAWFYHYVRPNIGTTQGGLWVWDEHATSHFEVPYFSMHTNLRAGTQDGPTIVFPTGGSVQTDTPLTSYVIRFAEPDRIEVDLRFDATMPPWVDPATVADGRPHHLDQFGRVHGTMSVRGRTFEIDCVAIRDRSWHRRSERWRTGGYGYCTAGTPEVAVLATSPLDVSTPDTAPVTGGFLLRDGVRARIVSGTRRVERDPTHAWVRQISIEGSDGLGRSFHAAGRSRSRIAMPVPGLHGVAWTSLVDWDIDGVPAWGDDQDCWPTFEWSTLRGGFGSDAGCTTVEGCAG